MSDDRIHPPTPRKRQQAKEQGRGPRSTELVTSGSLLFATAAVSWTGPSLAGQLINGLETALGRSVIQIGDPQQPFREILSTVVGVGALLLPVLVAMMVCGVTLQIIQSGLRMIPSRLAPSLDRISPATRIRRLFDLQSLSGFAITLLKLIALGAVFLYFVHAVLPQLLRLPGMSLQTIGPIIFDALTGVCLWASATMLVFACVDYALAWWRFERELRMTEQELREELRDMQRASTPPAASRTRSVQAVA